jgi:uncharacterized protein with ParB-like and HNH nuclease domain
VVNILKFLKMSKTTKKRIFDEILSHTIVQNKNHYLLAPKTVYDFFAYGHEIRQIPDYQRPYSWTKRNILDLLNDVLKLEKEPNGSWFLGPIFSTKETENDEISHLLDGQQRITTIQILMREASLVKFQFENIDWKSYPDLEKRINTIVKSCNFSLIKMDPEGSQSRFKTEETIADLFEEYITAIESITSQEDYDKDRKSFFKKLDSAKSNGSKTAGNIKDSIKTITDFIDTEIFKKKSNPSDNLELFCDFMDALLVRCWLIEIPLKHDDNSIQIFESINNRGKQLSLLDKLRYKSLILCTDSIRSEIKKEWKKVFIGLENLDNWGFIKNEDDFFKVLFNSINGDDITSESEFITLYEEKFLKDDASIIEFLEDVQKIIEFCGYLYRCLNIGNDFIEKNFKDKKRQLKVRALFQLLNSALDNSDNSRFLLFNLIRKYELFGQHELIVQGVWTIIRMVFYEEIFSIKKSNAIRIDFMKKIEDIENDDYCYSNIISNPNFNYSMSQKSILNLLSSASNKEAKFIIYFYNFVHDHNILVSGAADQFSKSELDHLFPRAWKNSWSGYTYKKPDLIDFIENINEEDYKNISIPLLKTELETLEDMELRPYTTLPFTQPNSIIEFIGNKWVLHSGTNIKTSNREFEHKKELYDDDRYIKIPSNQNPKIGIKKYHDFSYKEIIIRSLEIIDGCIDKFYNQWDDID